MNLVIDQLAQAAEREPQAPLAHGLALSNAEAWAQAGGVASWLIAQGFGPGTRSLLVQAPGGAERTIILLGALRAGSLVVESLDNAGLVFATREGRLVSAAGIALAALARCPVDAAVAERRLHIDADTPARMIRGTCMRHGDFGTLSEALAD